MENLKKEQQRYFSDPDMPFYGYPMTEENVKAVKQLWEDAKPKFNGDVVGLNFGTSGL